MLLAQVAVISTLHPENLSVNADAGTKDEVEFFLGPEPPTEALDLPQLISLKPP